MASRSMPSGFQTLLKNQKEGGGAQGVRSDGVGTACLAPLTATQLDVSRRELAEIPPEVWNLNLDAGKGQNVDLSAPDTGADRWWDQQELQKLLAASNRLTEVSSGCSVSLACLAA